MSTEQKNPLLRQRGIAVGTVKRTSTKQDALTQEITSKLIANINSGSQLTDPRTKQKRPDQRYAQDVVGRSATAVTDAENAMAMLPDIGLAAQVLVSTIIAPQDMTSNELSYNCSDDRFEDIKTPLVKVIQEYFDGVYKIKPRLAPWLMDILFRTGSVGLTVIPESAIDEIINSDTSISNESWRAEFDRDGRPVHYGLLGNANYKRELSFSDLKDDNGSYIRSVGTISQEALANDTPYTAFVVNPKWQITVSDNPNLLKLPVITRRNVSDKIQSVYAKRRMAPSMEATSSSDPKINSMFRDKRYQMTPVESVMTQGKLARATVGHPLDQHQPSEAIIPVFKPGTPSDHVGYYIALDGTGHPIKSHMSTNFFSDVRKQSQAAGDQSSQLLSQARGMQDGSKDVDDNRIKEAVALYTDAIERDLIERLENGVYGKGAEIAIARPTEVYRLMFARSMQQKQTQLLYVPVESMTYMAFDYNDEGVGRSLLEATKVLTAIRAMLLISNTMAAIKNSINHKKISVHLDEADMNPEQSVEMIVDKIITSSNPAFPFGASNPVDFYDYWARAGYQIEVSGNTNYPETTVGIEFLTGNNVQVNTELEENFRKRHLMAIGVPPEIVESSQAADFATQIITSNVLFSKRAMQHQDRFVHFVSDFIQKYVRNSQPLRDQLRKIIHANIGKLHVKGEATERVTDRLVDDFITSIQVTLPRADLSKLEEQSKDFDTFVEFLDKVIPAHIAPEMFDGVLEGDLQDAISPVIAATRALYIRRWLQENNVLPQLFELSVLGTVPGSAIKVVEEENVYMEGLERAILPYMTDRLKLAALRNPDLKKLKDTAGGTSSGDGDTSGGDAGGEDDEFGGGEDAGDDGSDAPAEDSAPPAGDEPPAEDADAEPTPADDDDDAPAVGGV